ncbi:unnamed protein product [Urochloa humidicola]
MPTPTAHGLQPRRADHRLFHRTIRSPVKAKRGLHSIPLALLPHHPRTFGASKTSGANRPRQKGSAEICTAPGFGALRSFLPTPPDPARQLRDSPPAGSGGLQIQEAHSVPSPPRLSCQVVFGQGGRERRGSNLMHPARSLRIAAR